MTLYLKYRPLSFESLVWQDFISKTLSAAITKNKLVWAYLFYWPRWTWKTSTARIFAKSINCLNFKNWNPCLKCDVCLWFQNDSLVDIVEIDAASHTWVDNIRDIIERAKFSPTYLKYKVYIIDEVHMLSKWAFNALLKILEEPPAHLKFILATTEIQKIPETILSRCQVYNFKPIDDVSLKKRLLYIASQEKIKVDDESIDFIIKQSWWWLRNAISLFEQLIVGDEIVFDRVISSYWIPQKEVLLDFKNKLLNKDKDIINDFDNISSKYNLLSFFKELLFLLRDDLVDSLMSWEDLSQKLYLLEELEKTIINSKNSFDLKLTFLVFVIKIVWDVKNNQIPLIKENTNTIKSPQSIKAKNETPSNITQNQEPKEEITPEDINSIFWEEELSQEPKTKEEKKDINEDKKNDTQSNYTKFDKELFLQTLKKLKAKWALTMSLRSSEFNFSEKKLTIYTKTKIWFKQITQTENISLMKSALNDLWYSNIDIIVK